MAGAPHGDGQRGAPGAAAEHGDPALVVSRVMPWLRAGRSRPAAAAASSSGQRERGAKCMASAVGHACAQALDAGPGDHRGIVGAQRQRRRDEGEAVPRAKVFQRAADRRHWRRRRRPPPATARAMSGNSPRKRARLRPTRSSSVSAIAAWKEAQMSATSLSRERRDRGRRLPHRRLQAGERKVEPRLALERTREIEAPGIAVQRRLLDVRAARIGQADQLRRLVEGLAQRIVDGRSPALIVADAAHQHDLRMAARNEQQQIGKRQPVGEAGGQRMALEMVDRLQRLARRGGQRLGRHQPDDQAADQAGTGRGGDRVDIGQRDAGIGAALPR